MSYDTTNKRHEKIYETYLSVLKGYGEHATKIPKIILYNEVAEIENYSVGRVIYIIKQQLKKKTNE